LIGGGRIVKVNTFSVLKGVVSSFTSMESIELCFPIKRRKGYWVFSIGKKIFSYETKRKKVVFIKEIEKLLEKIKEVFNPDFFGVKLLETENGFVVDRIILNPDLVSLEKVFGRKIFKDLFSYIKSKAEKPSAMDILFKILGRFRV
ncbi:MAG: hypothetical protein J7L39_00595, partial [Candidatus Aenigmarchaeota archaeon]|nr:hypothetical protein [Candidatus Aenigmarchaeota archaeon]